MSGTTTSFTSVMCFRKVVLVYLALFLFTSVVVSVSTTSESGTYNDDKVIVQNKQLIGSRRMLGIEEDEELLQQEQKPKKKSGTSTTTSASTPVKNKTKLIKPSTGSLSTKNQTKLIKNLSGKNQTKLLKPTNSTKPKVSNLTSPTNLPKPELKLKKLNSTSSKAMKAINSTKKPSDLLKLSSPKNKTTKTKQAKLTEIELELELELDSSKSKKNQNKDTTTTTTKPKQDKKSLKKQPSWIDQEEDDDLVSEFRDLPTKFQQTLLPDLERISTTSKAYINRYNKEMAKGFKPIVGHRYAATIASVVSFAFILIPLILVSLIVNRIKAYFSLQKILIFIQVYLSIYFSILCVSALVTGLEPLKFFYSTSQPTYVCVQVLQTLCYVLYLLLLLMYLVLIFSTECGLGSRMLGLAQTFVGYAVGLHYYVAVFHRVLLHQPPKTNWKVHGIYATCFLVICLFAGAERRKKAYLEEGGEEGKKS